MPNALKQKIISGIFWQGLERFGVQAVQFIVSIILARLLTPGDFGVIALSMVFIAISNIFIDSGFGQALIQKKELTVADESFVFWSSLGVASLIYSLLFFTAPYIALFYDNAVLSPILRCLGIVLFTNALALVPTALLTRAMLFRKKFFLTLLSSICSVAVGLGMAWGGCGIWTLVGQQLVAGISGVVGIYLIFPWRPALKYFGHDGKQLFHFGSRLLGSSLLNSVTDNLYSIVIGKVFSQITLGYFNRGIRYPQMISMSLCGTLSAVCFPAFVQLQHDPEAMKQILRKAIRVSSLVSFPVMLFFVAGAEPCVIILLTEKWRPAIVFMQVLSVAYMFYPIHVLFLQNINALGRSDIFLRLEIIKKILFFIVFLICLPFGVIALAWSFVIISFLGIFINFWPTRKLLNYRLMEFWIDVRGPLLCSFVVFVVLYGLHRWIENLYLLLFVQAVTGVLFYLSLCSVFRLQAWLYIWKLALEKNWFFTTWREDDEGGF